MGSALESGARAAGHGQHEAALAAAGRVLDIAPQCAAGQEMRVSFHALSGEILQEQYMGYGITMDRGMLGGPGKSMLGDGVRAHLYDSSDPRRKVEPDEISAPHRNLALLTIFLPVPGSEAFASRASDDTCCVLLMTVKRWAHPNVSRKDLTRTREECTLICTDRLQDLRNSVSSLLHGTTQPDLLMEVLLDEQLQRR